MSYDSEVRFRASRRRWRTSESDTSLPFSPFPLLSFALFGFVLALATPVVAALPARVLAPDVRGPGLGIYYLWYFGGMPILIALAGALRDGTGSAAAPLEFAVAMLVACLLLVAVFRFAQARRGSAAG